MDALDQLEPSTRRLSVGPRPPVGDRRTAPSLGATVTVLGGGAGGVAGAAAGDLRGGDRVAPRRQIGERGRGGDRRAEAAGTGHGHRAGGARRQSADGELQAARRRCAGDGERGGRGLAGGHVTDRGFSPCGWQLAARPPRRTLCGPGCRPSNVVLAARPAAAARRRPAPRYIRRRPAASRWWWSSPGGSRSRPRRSR